MEVSAEAIASIVKGTLSMWSNWAGNVRAEPVRIEAPGSIDELQAAVAEAADAGLGIRVAGSGHSFSPLCQTDGMLIDLHHLSGIESIDAETGEATILAGTKLHQIGEPLLAAGRALANQGDIDRQALAGAVATGTHGTGRVFGSFSSAVRSIELLTPGGELLTLDATSGDDLFRAATLSLGMIGIMTRIRLMTVPAYKLHERAEPLGFETCLERFPEAEQSHRHAEFWWIPPLDTCVLKTLSLTEAESFGGVEDAHPPGTIARYLKPEKVDWSSRVFPSTRSEPFVESECTLPITGGPDAMRAVRTLMRERHPAVRWAVEYRTVPGERSMLSPTAGQDSVTISVHHPVDTDWQPFMRDCDALFREHGGRPHWGKLHWMPPAELDSRYPEIETFRQIRRSLDPQEVLLNDYLRPMFG